TGFFAGGYVGAWVGSLAGGGAGALFALLTGVGAVGYRDPAFSLVENIVSTGLLLAIVGTLAGGGLGAALGVGLGTLIAASGDFLRRSFVALSCGAAGLAAIAMSAAMFRLDAQGQAWQPVALAHEEFVARVAAMGLIGLAGVFGGGLLGRILREVAWEPGAQTGVVAEGAEPRME
ncbi:MAG: hypothetical protein KY475_12250, partial [Planctomycetes bacterium]|nr:hypothetical protein [Planctomycetota bacterium]